MYNLEILTNLLYNIARHSFYADNNISINITCRFHIEQSELIIGEHDIGAKHEFETRELGIFWISVKISYPHFLI